MAVKLPSTLASQEYNPSYSKSPLGGETLDDLENDDNYIDIASRFLQGIGEKESDVDDLYEYFRDADWNLASGANRAFKELPTKKRL